MTTSYPFLLLSSGQTGVERGAYATAKALGIEVRGVMRANRRDELGPVPDEIARLLVPCNEKGPRRAREANVRAAWAVVVAVKEPAHPTHTTGMKQVMQCARTTNALLHVCGPHTDLDQIALAIMTTTCEGGSRHVYITGPRATRWPDGEELGRRIVRALALATQRVVGDVLVI